MRGQSRPLPFGLTVLFLQPGGDPVKRIVVLSDTQIPYQDKKALTAFYRFLDVYRPDELASVGDDVDFPQISRWNRGMEGEYKRDIQTHVDAGVRHFERLREVFPNGPIHVSRSNHMDRPLRYVRQYAPGLMGLRALTIPSLLEFERLRITYHETPYEVAPGWLLIHGDELAGSSPTPGSVAMKHARRFGKSVICGHTHKMGMQHEHSVMGGKVTRTLYGVEVGNMMQLSAASYHASPNWQQGFGILYVDGRHVTPSLIPVTNGRFTVEGKMYA